MVTAMVCKSSTCLLCSILTNYLKNPFTLDPSLFNIVNLFPLALSLSHLKIAAVNPPLVVKCQFQSLKDDRLISSQLKKLLLKLDRGSLCCHPHPMRGSKSSPSEPSLFIVFILRCMHSTFSIIYNAPCLRLIGKNNLQSRFRLRLCCIILPSSTATKSLPLRK